jgi:hypothetical protein
MSPHAVFQGSLSNSRRRVSQNRRGQHRLGVPAQFLRRSSGAPIHLT